jgi:hypothetical protein
MAGILWTLARETLRPPRPINPIRQPRRGWDPALRAGLVPLRQAHNLGEVFRALLGKPGQPAGRLTYSPTGCYSAASGRVRIGQTRFQKGG